MSNTIALIIDCENQEIIERELTAQEIEEKQQAEIEYKTMQKKIEEENAKKEELKQSAIQKLLSLGLSEDEVNSLIL